MNHNTVVYDENLLIRDALQLYFNKYHFENGGYQDKYFRIKLGPFFIPIPNTKQRIDAVKFHDIHHLLTGYTAYWKGEVEIGAWEIASGCGKYWVAWLLNFGSVFIGLFLFPKALFIAFMKGRRVKSNLYYHYTYNEVLLNKTLAELKKELNWHSNKNLGIIDYFYFLSCIIIVLCPLFTICLFIYFKL